MNELDRILDGLLTRTIEGRLKWTPAAAEDQFVTSVDAISVMIQDPRWPLSQGIRLEIFDERGQLVEVLNGEAATINQGAALTKLYAEARRSALNSQVTLEKLARALGT